MKCPVCKETQLLLSERSGIEIDYCPDCRGVWLDRGELDKLIDKSSHVEPSPSFKKQSSDYYQKPYKKKKSFLEEIFD